MKVKSTIYLLVHFKGSHVVAPRIKIVLELGGHFFWVAAAVVDRNQLSSRAQSFLCSHSVTRI